MNKKKDLPAMPFYIGDWKKDPGIQVLSREEKMIWLEMLMLMWESDERGYLTINKKPISNKLLSAALNLKSEKLTDTLTFFEELGLFSRRKTDSAIFSRKIIHIIELSDKRSKAGRQGGNPNLLNQDLTKKQAKGLSTTESESEDVNKDVISKGKRLLREKQFNELWSKYPRKLGKDKALLHFKAQVKTDKDWQDINKALNNYLKSKNVIENSDYIQHGQTWFNKYWRDWIDYVEPVKINNNQQNKGASYGQIKRHSDPYSQGKII